MFITNYKNTVLSKEVADLIIEVFNNKTLPLLAVKRPTRLNKTNAASIMSFVAKGTDLIAELKWVEENAVVDGVPQNFGDMIGKYNPTGQVYYHGVNVSRLIVEHGGYPDCYNAFEGPEPCVEELMEHYGKRTPKVPATPKDDLEDFLEEEEMPEATPQNPEEQEVPKESPQVPEEMPKSIPGINQEVILEETKKMVLKELETYRLVLNDDAKAQMVKALEGSVDEITRRVAKIQGTEKIVVLNGEEKKLPQQLYHKQFKQMLNLIANKFNIYLYGEAGDGKTHLVKQCADALGLKFYTQTPSDVIGLLGYNDINGVFQETPFTLWVKNGGLLYLSEFDNVGDAILSINTALANGFITINQERYNLHKDCVFVADGNTKGNGANAVYCGRNAIDGATLDRFLFVTLEHDADLELKLSGDNKDWMSFITQFRKIRDTKRIKCLATMRSTLNMAKLEQIGYPVGQALESSLLKGLAPDVAKTLADEIIVKLPNNKYAKALSEVVR